MKTIRISKEQLTDAVKTNATAHAVELGKAQIAWRKQYALLLRATADQVLAGEDAKPVVSLPKPVDHTRDYGRVIKMLEMTADEILELELSDFNRYVLDEWEWAHDKLLNSTYAGSLH